MDLKKLNDRTIGDSFSIPHITDILDQLGNAKYFTTLDFARSGYHQIAIAEKDKHKTAFSRSYADTSLTVLTFDLKTRQQRFND